MTELKSEKESFLRLVRHFNDNVIKKFSLDKRTGEEVTEAERSIDARFMFLTSLRGSLVIGKASQYDYQDMPEGLTLDLAEVFAKTYLNNQGELDLDGLLPALNENEDKEKLETNTPHLWSLYQQRQI